MGTKREGNGVERVYEAAATWVERALRTDDSLFTPGKPIWSRQWLGELHERFLNHPDEGSASSFEKFQGQLRDSPPEVYQLLGEALYFYFLIVSTKSSTDEQKRIDEVLGLSPSPVAIPPDLVASLTPDIADPGVIFHACRPYQVGFLIEFCEQWKEQGPDERRQLLNNPWEFKDFVTRLNFRSETMRGQLNKARTQREALLHLVFPDTFEGILSVEHKAKIAKAFANYVTQPMEDVDRKLAQIRLQLEAQYGISDELYYNHPEIHARWDGKNTPDPWDEFVRLAQRFIDTGQLESEEIDYKVEIGRKLAEAREAVLAGAGDWASLVKRGTVSNLIYSVQLAQLHDWIDESPDDALRALRAIWAEDDSSVAERVSGFCELFPQSVISGKGTRMNLASVLLMGVEVQQYPPFRVTLFDQAYTLTGYRQPEQPTDEIGLYEHALGFLDRFIEEARAHGLTLRHRLDAQSLIWASDRLGYPLLLPPLANLSPSLAEKQEGLLSPTDPWSPSNIETLAKELLWEPHELQKIIDGLKDKRQAIFQGPPGTGKTYVAKSIAEWCKAHGGGYKIVQFHPSYSYEDFVEGFRPTIIEGGQAGFKLTEGPLRRIANDAAANPNATFILVIDEINRGNVAKVLGELYFLLEYRDEKITLQYSNEQFSLPENLWVIGTMNTTDRSIALVDAALRRRFYFFGFFPDEPPIQGLLGRWLKEYNPDEMWVADLVDVANHELKDRHLGIGPSYFMKKDTPLDENRVRFIWEQGVIPYIEEQCFGDEAELNKFAYDTLKGKLNGTAPESSAAGAEAGSAADADNGQPENNASDV